MCINMCIDMSIRVCVDMCMDMCIDTYIDMYIHMCIDRCMDMCIEMFINMCMDVCMDMCAHVSGHAYTCVFMHVYKHVLHWTMLFALFLTADHLRCTGDTGDSTSFAQTSVRSESFISSSFTFTSTDAMGMASGCCCWMGAAGGVDSATPSSSTD